MYRMKIKMKIKRIYCAYVFAIFVEAPEAPEAPAAARTAVAVPAMMTVPTSRPSLAPARSPYLTSARAFVSFVLM